MKECTLKNVNSCLNTNISFYLETSGGLNFNLYLNVVHFFNSRFLWKLKIVVYMYRCLIHVLQTKNKTICFASASVEKKIVLR